MSDNNKLRIEYVPVSDGRFWDKNPKKHDIPSLIEALSEYGMQDPPKFDETLQALVYGNGRTTALYQMMTSGMYAPPTGIVVDEETGVWLMPIVFGNSLSDKDLAVKFAIDHNNLTLGGADFSAIEMAQLWEEESYLELLSHYDKTITVSEEDKNFLQELWNFDFKDYVFEEDSDEEDTTHDANYSKTLKLTILNIENLEEIKIKLKQLFASLNVEVNIE